MQLACTNVHFYIHLMLHACVQRFDMIGRRWNILESERGLSDSGQEFGWTSSSPHLCNVQPSWGELKTAAQIACHACTPKDRRNQGIGGLMVRCLSIRHAWVRTSSRSSSGSCFKHRDWKINTVASWVASDRPVPPLRSIKTTRTRNKWSHTWKLLCKIASSSSS
jgi:hypothetical protein